MRNISKTTINDCCLHGILKSNVTRVSLKILILFLVTVQLNGQNKLINELVGATSTDLNLISQNFISLKINTDLIEFKLLDQDSEQKNSEKLSFQLNTDQQRTLLKERPEAFVLILPLNGSDSIQLNLYKVEILPDQIQVSTSGSGPLSISNYNYLFYRGYIDGNTNSIVSLTLSLDYLKIMIGQENGNFFISEKSQNEYELTKDIISEHDMLELSCHTSDINVPIPNEVHQNNYTFKSPEPIDLFIVTDHDKYLDHNQDSIDLLNFIVDLVNESASLYALSNVDIQLSELYMWTTTDPYAALNGIDYVLDKLGEEYYNGFNGHLAHLVSGRNLGGGYA